MKTKIAASLLVLVCLAASGTPSASARPNKDVFPEVISLPTSWGPEGIAIGRGTEFFAGARQTSPFQGAIYKGDLRTGEGAILVPAQPGRFALGLKLDRRSNLLFVAGGPSGSAFIYDADSGADVAVIRFTTSASFINDVVVTRDAAYFTDSLNPFIYKLPLGPGGKIPANPTFTALPLTGDFVMTAGFNLNGIVATQSGDALIVVQSSTGLLYRVDPTTGETAMIEIGDTRLTNGDGLWLDGRTLYVVRNRLNQIAVIELDRALDNGEYTGNLTSAAFDVPTTIAEFGNALYAVNARFGTPIPAAAYQVVRVSK